MSKGNPALPPLSLHTHLYIYVYIYIDDMHNHKF